MKTFERAKELLLFTRNNPKIQPLSKDALLNRVATILEIAILDFDIISFYKKHLGNQYWSYSIGLSEVESNWANAVIDDALNYFDIEDDYKGADYD